ncbi:MAG: DNA ligase-associated DEXH box helicase, partial [Rhodobacteraceae bacterium]|nr:DNA ligase-associated DEXH box helicase [Paracoccaceae bacterium]
YGANFAKSTQPLEYGEVIEINGVSVWLTPAGHILGSAQITVEYKGMRMTFTGDYKRRADPTCATFEPVDGTHVFISEATFGLPVFRHPSAAGEAARLLASADLFPDRTHVVGAYALGKAQRMIRLVRDAGHDAPILIHGALDRLCRFYAAEGVDLGRLEAASGRTKAETKGRIVVCPP